MMKLLLKTLMITIISCSLSFSEMIAYAQSNGQVTEVSKGVYQKQSSDKVSGVKDDDMMSSITMIAVGFIASRLYKYKMTTDVMIAAAGGAAFILGEIMTTNSYKDIAKDLEVQITNRSDNKIDNAQIETLQKLKKSYEEAKKSIGTKKTMQLAAAAAFGAAALMAAYWAYQEYTAKASCLVALNAAKVCPPAVASATTSELTETELGLSREMLQPSMLGEGLSKAKRTTLLGNLAALDAAIVAGTATVATSAVCGSCGVGLTACKSLIAIYEASESYGILDPIANMDFLLKKPHYVLAPTKVNTCSNAINNEVKNPSLNKSFFKSLLEKVIPSANASMMNLLLGGGGAAAGILIGQFTTLGPMVDSYMLTPNRRAIIWGVLAGLSYMASNASQNQMDKIDENIKKIDKLIQELQKQSKAINAQNIASQKVDIANGVRSVNGQDITLGSNGQKTPCIASSGNTNCTSMQATMTALPDFAGLPDSMKTLASNFAKLGDNMSGTDRLSASTLSSASALGNKAGAINKSLRKKQADLNSLRKKNGLKEIDFAGDQRKLLSRMNGAVKNSLQKGNMSPAGFFAAVNATPFSNTIKEDPKGDLKKVGVANTSAAPIKKLSAPTHDDLDLKDALESNDSGVLADGSKEGSANDLYDMKGTEINPDNGISIFELISNRYQKSGYPKLLEEETPVDIEQK